MSAKKLRKIFLKKAPDVMERMMEDAGYHRKTSLSPAEEEIWELVKDCIKKEQDLESIQATSTESIVALLGKGKISVNEAIQLMELLRTQQEVDLAPELLKQMKKLNKKK